MRSRRYVAAAVERARRAGVHPPSEGPELDWKQARQFYGAHIRLARLRLGRSQDEVARRMDVPVEKLERIETGLAEHPISEEIILATTILKDGLEPFFLDVILFRWPPLGDDAAEWND